MQPCCVLVYLTTTEKDFKIIIMSSISPDKISLVKKFYYLDKMCMREISERLGVSIHAVVHFMRKYDLPRRSYKEMNRLRFERKSPSFKWRKHLSRDAEALKLAGAMLYWGEGYKSEKGSVLDFTNSDPVMIKIFLNFMHSVFELDESKFRVLLYCYADQNTSELIKFWSDLSGIGRKQFIKPYVRKDFRKDGRKMHYGMVHIRYIDKKLLLAIKELIEHYKIKFAQVDP